MSLPMVRPPGADGRPGCVRPSHSEHTPDKSGYMDITKINMSKKTGNGSFRNYIGITHSVARLRMAGLIHH